MMKFIRTSFFVAALMTVGLVREGARAAGEGEELTISSDTVLPALRTLGGQSLLLEDLKKYKLVVVVAQGTSCPVLQKSYPDLLAIQRDFKKKDVAFFLLSAAPQDELKEIEKEAGNFGVSQMVLQDPKQLWLQPMGLKSTGETVVLQPVAEGWRLLYRGAMSDRINFDRTLPKAKNEFLRKALADALAGRAIKVKSTGVFGCSITWLNR